MAKKSFLPSKPIIYPVHDENLTSYADRLLWHQLGLQINNHRELMLTKTEFVETVTGLYPDAKDTNVPNYENYFNTKHEEMGFREVSPMPVRLDMDS